MNTTKSWTLKSEQQQSLMHSFISSVKQTELTQKNHLCEQLSEMDKMLSRVYARHHYDPMMVTKQSTLKNSNTKLQLPSSNTLTDALIRNTLGCDQKYAKQYMQLIGQTTSENQKQRKILEIKKKFSDSNSYVDTMANAKPFVPMKSWQTQRPVVDNEHEAYLKTQLIFLQKPNNQKISEKQYYQKYYDTITKKIQELGGMQDTLCRMEHTLKQNQMSNFKDRQILKQPQNHSKDNLMSSKSQLRNVSQINDKQSNSWKAKSKQMREKYRQSINKNT